MSRVKGIASLFATARGRRPVRRRQRQSWLSRTERLESRTLLTVTPTLVGPGVLEIVYDPIAAQSCIVEIEQAGTHNIPVVDFTADVNVYAPSNAATTPSSWFFPNISQIIVTVQNYDGIGVNNNSLTIKGINGPSDRIIIGGGGRTAAGRWSSETADGNQCLLSIEGIDDLTVTAGGTISVSGSFTNDTEDASIRAIGQVVERAAEQHTATVTIGETTPAVGVQPRPWLYSNTIEIVGAELDIYSTITATDRIDLRAGDSAPDTGRSNLVLPYDITVLGNPTTGEGVLSLFSTKNITQLQTSTILTPTLVAVSSVPRAATTDGPWMIDLGSANNDFDEISLGMTAAPGDATVAATEGRIGIRDVDDLAVVDFGILASTGRVRIDTAGPLSITAPIQATGLILESDDSVVSSPGAIMRLGDLGITVLANAVFAPTSNGDVTLAGPITILDDTPAALVANKIVAAGTVTLSGGFYCPHAGTTTFAGGTGVVLTSPVQVGSTKLDANSKVIEIFDHDLNLISATGGIDVGRVPGNDATPFAVQATNIIALDAPESITIAGSMFAGTIYGDPSDLTETQALPAITIRGLADVNITATGSLRTQSYETNPDETTNPLVGKISITDATQLNVDGKITADGAVDIAILGDVYLYGPTTARENVAVRTTAGGIDVQGAVVSTGGTYTAAPAAGSQREPNVILWAPIGGISTSGLGTLTAGTVTAGGATTFGSVRLTAQQDIVIGADIDTPGGVVARVTLGRFDLDALLRAGNGESVTIEASTGITELEFGRIQTALLDVMITEGATAADILLPARGNRVLALQARNFTPAGGFTLFTDSLLDVQRVETLGDVEIAATGTVVVTGLTQSDGASIALSSQGSDLTVVAAVNASAGGITITALAGEVSASGLTARDDVTVRGLRAVSLGGSIRSELADIRVESTGGSVGLFGGLYADAGSVEVVSLVDTLQLREVIAVRLASPVQIQGQGAQAPVVTVEIDPPTGGGRVATALAVVNFAGYVPEGGGIVIVPGGGAIVIPPNAIGVWEIVGLDLTDGGDGYQPGENPQVRVLVDGELQAFGQAIVSVTEPFIVADQDVTLRAGYEISLFGQVRANQGDVLVTSVGGDLDLSAAGQLLYAVAGSVGVTAGAGSAVIRRIKAGADVTLTTQLDARLLGQVEATTGDVAVTSTSGTIDVRTGIHAKSGAIRVEAGGGSSSQYAASVRNLRSGTDVAVAATGGLSVQEQIVATNGDISLRSVSDSIDLTTGNINAMGGAVRITAQGSVIQPAVSGVSSFIDVTSPGTSVGVAAPDVEVEIAAPLSGGAQATAAATVDIIGWVPAGGGSIIIPDRGAPVVVPPGAVPVWGVIQVTVTNPGSGYAPFENPAVSFTGINNAAARAFGPGSFPINIVALEDITVAAGNDVRLTTIVRSDSGDVTISAIDGLIDLSEPGQLVQALGGSITVTARAGSATVQQLAAISDIVVDAYGAVTMLDSIDSDDGDVTLTSLTRNLDFTAFGALIYAGNGGVTLSAANGAILTAPTLNVANDVKITSLNAVALRNEITSETGNIEVESISGGITLAANVNAIAGSVALAAQGAITQLSRGVHSVEVLTGGSGYNAATQITIAAPVSGGATATARPVVGANGALIGVLIVDAGSGYGVDEEPAVTITGSGAGASAIAHVTQGVISIAADGDVVMEAGNGVTLVNPLNSLDGDVFIRTLNGNLDFSDPNALISAENGSVTLISVNGQIINPPVLQVTGGVSMSSFQNLNVVAPITANIGGITLESTGGAVTIGTPAVAANLLADGRVTLKARNGITQPNGFIRGAELLVTNSTNAAVTLGNPLNNVDNVSIRNLGAVTYVDADDFETGINRTAPLGVEVSGDAVSLSSVAPYSVVRVVSGLSYRSLSIAAGTQSGTTVGTVEFVTTSESDNTNLSPFAGTLRDMIKYARTNQARYTVGGSLRPQPMALVFDEAGYPVEQITVAANLPVLTLPVDVLGSRLEASVAAAGVGRVGIRGTPAVARGLTYGRGSDGSRIESTALYGFSMGSSMLVVSGRNTFQNLNVGMNDAGTPDPNRIGLLLSGVASTGNLVGGEVEAEIDPDIGVGNHFVANRAAGIFIDNNASGNRIGGNVFGDASGGLPAFANGDGIRIRNASGNLIGLPGTTGAPVSVSNVIAGNLSSGVLVLNANSGTLARANKIQNNLIEGNGGATRSNTGAGAGVLVHGSTFVDIGGSGSSLGNTIVDQGFGGVAAVDGVRIVNSGNVRVIGNDLGVVVDPESGAEIPVGNTGHGISVARSTAVEVSGRNIIGGNLGDGVAISDASSGVSVTGNLIGLFSSGREAGNFGDGVSIRAAIGNTVGAGNRIAFNRDGVSINDAVAATLSAGNTVTGSEIFRNLATGVRVVGGSRSSIGGLAAATGNVIGENDGDGVRIEWSSVSGTPTGHAVHGNAIGTDTNGGFVNRGNVGSGIVVSGGTANLISNGNRVMNNLQSGVDLVGGSANVVGGAGVAGNIVESNLDDGVRVLAVGATGWVRFVRVTSGGSNYSADTFVTLGGPSAPGGTTARAVPVIRTVRGVPGVIVGFFVDDPGLGYTPNEGVSVAITDPTGSGSGAAATATATLASTTLTSARDHVVQGNAIRLNGTNGVAAVGSSVSGLTIGQRVTSTGVTGVGNVIEDNIGYGVAVAAGAQRVSAQGNSLFGNLLGGIQIESLANRSAAQTLRLTSAEIRQPSGGGGQQVVVRGTLANPLFPSQQYSVDIYASLPEDGDYPALTGYQARRYLGRATVTAGANGVASLAITITAAIEVGEVITATATALRFEAGSTSMISNGVTADYPGIPTPRF